MATLESYNIRSEAAIKRIEAMIIGQWGVKSAPLPIMNKDRDALRCNQLERIADMLEAVERFQSSNDKLDRAIALVSSGNWTKAELESLLLGGD